MFPAEDLRDWRGRNVIDPDGAKIGKLENVYVDTGNDEPSFITVRVGWLSGRTRLVFAPVAGASVSPDAVRVRYPKKLVRSAPSLEVGGELSADDEPRIFAHYQIDYLPGLSGKRRLSRG